MDNPIIIVFICMGKSIRIKRVKVLAELEYFELTKEGSIDHLQNVNDGWPMVNCQHLIFQK